MNLNVFRSVFKDVQEVGESEAGMPKMELTISPHCVPFMIRVGLCQKPSITDALSIAETLALRELRQQQLGISVCADMLPKDLYLTAMKKKMAQESRPKPARLTVGVAGATPGILADVPRFNPLDELVIYIHL